MLDELLIYLVSFAILEDELKKCSCSHNRYLYLREDISELESMCHEFEKEDGVMDHVQEVECSNSMFVQTESVINGHLSRVETKIEGTMIEESHQNHMCKLFPTRSAVTDCRPKQVPDLCNVRINFNTSLLVLL
jgi:hypothetical protein